MPLLPPKRSAPAADNRILVGSLVEYEQHGQPALAAVTGDRKDKWIVQNYRGAQLELPAARLYLLPGRLPASATTEKARSAFLEDLHNRVTAAVATVPLGELWETVRGEKSEVSVQDLTELAYGDNSLEHHLAVRRATLADRVYFKRLKTTLEPRPNEVVEELLVQQRVEEAKRAEREALVEALCARVRGSDTALPPTVRVIELYAAIGKGAEEAKAAQELVDEVIERTGVSLPGHAGDRAFQLLVAARHFAPDENLLFLRHGRESIFSADVLAEAEALEPPDDAAEREDLCHLAAYTIDAEETLDLDDALSFEELPNGFRIGVHISDAAAWIREGSRLEREAFHRATSIYTPDAHVPMLPPALCQRKLSLIAGEPRLAVSLLMECDQSFEMTGFRLVPSIICVRERLTYQRADEILTEEEPSSGSEVARTLHGLWNAASACEAARLAAGAIQFSRREMYSLLDESGRVSLIEANEDTPARKLVSEMMVLANVSAAQFGASRRAALIYRVQEPPDVDPHTQGYEIPEGPAREFFQRSFLKRSVTQVAPGPHSGVGVSAYIQSTSPIRRAGDLLNQRQLKHLALHGEPRYTPEEFTELLGGLEAGLEEASLIQRERSRYFLLKYLKQEKITSLGGTIMKVDGPKPLVELDTVMLIAPFHVLGDSKNTEVLRKRRGERIRVRIDSLDPRSDSLVLRETPPD